MGPQQHENIVKVLGAFTRRDGKTAGETIVDMKSESQASPEGRELFIQGIQNICDVDESQNFIENVGDYITDICSLACIHRVKLEGAFVNAALAVEIMEGLASALHPDLKVQKGHFPPVGWKWTFKHIEQKDRFGGRNEEDNERVKGLLFDDICISGKNLGTLNMIFDYNILCDTLMRSLFWEHLAAQWSAGNQLPWREKGTLKGR